MKIYKKIFYIYTLIKTFSTECRLDCTRISLSKMSLSLRKSMNFFCCWIILYTGRKLWKFLTRTKIFTLYLQIFFTFSFTLSILLWITICWRKFEISSMVMLRIFLLKIYQWTHSDKILAWKFKNNKGTYTCTCLNFSWKAYKKIFHWKPCENRKKVSISNF